MKGGNRSPETMEKGTGALITHCAAPRSAPVQAVWGFIQFFCFYALFMRILCNALLQFFFGESILASCFS
jgi:hypothetical protein